MKVLIHVDGGARGNPGPAGAGVVIRDESGHPILEAGYFLGHMTNNQAEYTALLRSLHAAGQAGADQLSIRADSELLVRQMTGVYKVKNPGLKPLYDNARRLLQGFRHWEITHVRREANDRADELANAAMDAGRDVIEIDVPVTSSRRRGAKQGSTAAPAAASVSNKPPRPEDRSSAWPIEARCLQPPDRGVCPAPCARDASYRFDHTVPAGVCLHAARSLLRAVEESSRTGESRRARCQEEGCGAEFEIRPSAVTEP